MLEANKALVSSCGRFVYLEKKSGGYICYVNYDSMLEGMPYLVNTNQVESAQLDAKMELLEYVRTHK